MAAENGDLPGRKATVAPAGRDDVELEQVTGLHYLPGEPISRHGNLRLGGEVDHFVVVHEEDALLTALSQLRGRGPIRISYGLDELLAHDEGTPGSILKLGVEYSHCEVRDQGIVAGSACPLARVGVLARRAGFKGLERFSTFPGTVGGWLTGVGLLSASVVVRRLRLASGRSVKSVLIEDALSLKGQLVFLDAVIEGDLPVNFPAPVDPGAMLDPFPDMRRVLERSGLLGIRLRGIRICSEIAGLVVNLGEGSPRDLELILKTLRERLYRDHGLQVEPRLGLLSRPSTRRGPR